MELSHREYYALETLAFLASFPNHSWTHKQIATTVVLQFEMKRDLALISPDMPVNKIRDIINEAAGSLNDAEDVRLIAETVRRLREAKLIRRAGRGFRVTDAGINASWLKVMEAIGRSLKTADCVSSAEEDATFDCPKRESGNCYSCGIYSKVHGQLEELLSSVTIASMLQKPD